MDNSGPVFSVYSEDDGKTLTKRELAAMFAMAGLLANPNTKPTDPVEGIARQYAIDLLKVLNETPDASR